MIWAIDPGTYQSAWATLDGGRPTATGTLENIALLKMVRSQFDPSLCSLAIEAVASYGMAVGKEVFDTCLWIGQFKEAWESRGGTVRLVYRKEVKLHLCETVKANDSNIRHAILDRFGGKEKAMGKKSSPGPLFGIKGDEWAALAVALTDQNRMENRKSVTSESL